jgi:CRP-like cAMP-binding protein
MTNRAELKQIVMLGYLTDEMLDQLIPITDLLLFDDKEVIFREGDKADRFYMLKQGKVLLEQRITDKITVSMSSIKPGFSFGWSAMLDEKVYANDAICAEPCKILSFRENKIRELFEKNHSLGFIMSQRLLRIIKKRYDIQTEQFIKTLTHHPDLSDLFDTPVE